MAYDAILDSEIEVGDAITQSLMQKIKDNSDFFNSAISGVSGALLSNNSFDIDSDSNGEPDSWDITTYTGGSSDLDATNAAHGTYALKFVHPGGSGNGGGYADSDYLPCNEDYPFFVEFLQKCSQSGVKNQVLIRYYTEAKVFISTETIYSETTNPTAWSITSSSSTAIPSTAQYCKVRVVGGFTDTDPGSSTNIWFDNVLINYNVITAGSTYPLGVMAWNNVVGGGYTKKEEYFTFRPGVIKTWLFLSGSDTHYGRIYINGVAVGTERSVTGGVSTWFEEDITVEIGDLVQIYAYSTSSGGGQGLLEMFSDNPVAMFSTDTYNKLGA